MIATMTHWLASQRLRPSVVAVGLLVCLATWFLFENLSVQHVGGTYGLSFPLSGRPQSRFSKTSTAGNSTVGFHSVNFINLPSRYDRLDAMSLQAYLSGVEIVEEPGVEADQIHDVGMPPTNQPDIKVKEKACWRAHANIWSRMLRSSIPAILILESDANWDIHFREIMENLNEHFIQFLQQQADSAPSASTATDGDNSTATREDAPRRPVAHSADDPWQSSHWDILSIGQCTDNELHKDEKLIYHDPFVVPGEDYYGQKLGEERVIRKSGGIVCTTAYAVSRQGAAKLLLRSSINLDGPVDLLMGQMIKDGDLQAYSITPVIVGQWGYLPDIGMDNRGANSDINDNGEPIDEHTKMNGWDGVWKSKTVWKVKTPFPQLKYMTLEEAWKRIVGSSKASS